MKKSTIAIIGTGTVGSTIAYTLMMRNLISKLILIDSKDIKCTGELLDLSDALSFSSTSEIIKGNLSQAGQADIAIITAGIPQKPGQSRLDLLKTNYTIIKNVIEGMKPLNKDLIIIVVTNPVDILTYHAQTLAELPKNQIFGSGTFLDTQRLKYLISKKMNIAPQSINLSIVGEHGDSQVALWSSCTIDGIPLIDFPRLSPDELNKMADNAKQKAYEIIACKGSTAFGIAACVADYCQNIIFDTKKIIPLSCYIKEFDVCMSMPVVIGCHGIETIITPSFNDIEKKNLQKSASLLKDYRKEITIKK